MSFFTLSGNKLAATVIAAGALVVTGTGAAVSQDQQEVLALRVVADLSVETTAEIMGKTPGAIKQLQRRALCRLRKLRPALGEGGHHDQ